MRNRQEIERVAIVPAPHGGVRVKVYYVDRTASGSRAMSEQRAQVFKSRFQRFYCVAAQVKAVA